MFILVMGVMGAGKTTVGMQLARSLSFEFLDADDFHSSANRARLSRGQPLTDEDRAPWLETLRAAVERTNANRKGIVLACSALKAAYRDVLLGDGRNTLVVYLRADEPLLAARLMNRTGHFASPGLLQSQLATLEEPDDALSFDAALPVSHIVRHVVARIAQSSKPSSVRAK